MTRTRRLLLTAAVALAGAFAAAGPASAASDGTSNTIMFAEFSAAKVAAIKPGATCHQVVSALSFTAIEFKNPGLSAFMDYTDDACVAFQGGQEGEE